MTAADEGREGAVSGNRTLLLHWEIKRHQAWWKRVIESGLLTRLAEHSKVRAWNRGNGRATIIYSVH